MVFNAVAEVKVSYTTNVKPQDRKKITSSDETFEILQDCFDQDTLELQEQFIVLLLNRANHLMGFYRASIGGTAGTVVDQKLIFLTAIGINASSIILAHNHPSGNIQPSSQDKTLTANIKAGGALLGIEVLDHLIITRDRYFSFADEGTL